eukprot:479474_1
MTTKIKTINANDKIVHNINKEKMICLISGYMKSYSIINTNELYPFDINYIIQTFYCNIDKIRCGMYLSYDKYAKDCVQINHLNYLQQKLSFKSINYSTVSKLLFVISGNITNDYTVINFNKNDKSIQKLQLQVIKITQYGSLNQFGTVYVCKIVDVQHLYQFHELTSINYMPPYKCKKQKLIKHGTKMWRKQMTIKTDGYLKLFSYHNTHKAFRLIYGHKYDGIVQQIKEKINHMNPNWNVKIKINRH